MERRKYDIIRCMVSYYATMIRTLIRKIIYGAKASSASYVKYLRSMGMEIGEETTIYAPTKTLIDATRPWLVSIGRNVKITEGVTILTHGFDWSVLKGVYGEIIGSAEEVSIGNNVFIGMRSTILKGVHIGDNVIIGANSLVNKNIPSNCVAAGNPCKVIMSLDEYYHKRKLAFVNEAKELVYSYRERYGKEQDEKALHEFFWLFTDGDDQLPECWENMMKLGGNYSFTRKKHRENKKLFDNFNDFLKNI